MNEERARLFVALELPPHARTRLTQWRDEQLGEAAGLRLTDPESLHATLCFLGSRPLAEIDPIVAACETMSSHRRMLLTFAGALWLPPRRPHVLAIGLDDRSDGLTRLQSGLSRALQAGGWYEPERRPFLAHVTLARVAWGARVRPVRLAPPAPLRFPATRITLLHSHLGGPRAARYERLATVELRGA